MPKKRSLSAELRAEIFDGPESIATFNSLVRTVDPAYTQILREYLRKEYFTMSSKSGMSVVVHTSSHVVFESFPNGDVMSVINDMQDVEEAIYKLESAVDILREIAVGIRRSGAVSIGCHEKMKSKLLNAEEWTAKWEKREAAFN